METGQYLENLPWYFDSLIRSTCWDIFCKIGFYACQKRKGAYRECLLKIPFFFICIVCLFTHTYTQKRNTSKHADKQRQQKYRTLRINIVLHVWLITVKIWLKWIKGSRIPKKNMNLVCWTYITFLWHGSFFRYFFLKQ